MEGDSYTQKAYKEVYFSNSNVSFEFFYRNMGNLLIELISELNLYTINKKIFSFIGNFLHAVNTEERKHEIQEKLINISRELEHDDELKKLIRYDQQNIDIQVPYLQKYYHYFLKEIRLLSAFLGSLDRTYMPTTDLSKSLFKWKNYLQFFNSYITLKQEVTNNLNAFSLLQFQGPVNSIIIFYYTYNQYVTRAPKQQIEACLGKLIEFIINADFLKLVTKEYKTSKDQELLDSIKWRMNHIFLEIFNKINREHSIYNIIPKVQRKVYIDSTNI